ncbi:hypothetical protein EDC01DRAFT_194881 [Geopyxis carbonaria]|nr:hypothetical protein EDC01DRAFT_194881 [Geopyxis carbonaria]
MARPKHALCFLLLPHCSRSTSPYATHLLTSAERSFTFMLNHCVVRRNGSIRFFGSLTAALPSSASSESRSTDMGSNVPQRLVFDPFPPSIHRVSLGNPGHAFSYQ